MKIKKIVIFFLLALIVTFNIQALEKTIPSPEKFLGFTIGQDFKLANWTQILSYFDLLDSSSDSVKVIELGKSTLGRRFIMAVITSPSNMERLEELRKIHVKLHDPRTVKEGEKEILLKNGKAIVLISCSIHSTEIAASQMSMELAYKLATEHTPEMQKILEEVVLLLVPSVNPDGIDLVTDWYAKNLGTPYEASRMPWLYHYYTGHDNNRDWFMFTQKESKILSNVIYHEWFPLLVYDIHQMGSTGPRLFIPPYADPVNPNIDPLLLREMNVLTSIALSRLTKAGKTGIATNSMFDTWYCAANRAAPLRHNMIGVLSEAASANLASPIFLKRDQIRIQGPQGIQEQSVLSSYLEPWPGGWWRLRDIVEYEEIIALSFLETIAKEKEKYLSNYHLFAQRQIEKGKTEPPFAYIVPQTQRDVPTTFKLIQILQQGGIEIYQAQKPFTADEVKYPAQTFVIPLVQPYRSSIKDLLETKSYPAQSGSQGIEGLPYDEASWTLPLQMGIKVVEAIRPFKSELKLLKKIQILESMILGKGKNFFLFDNKPNNGSILINRLQKKGIRVDYAAKPFRTDGHYFQAGTIFISSANINRTELFSFAKDLGLKIYAIEKKPNIALAPVSCPKIGVYQSWVPNMDEGWLRWTLEQFEFPFKILHNEEIKAGNLNQSYTHIILPSMSNSILLEGRKEGDVPPQYTGGIGKEGINSLEHYVRQGGKLVSIGSSADFTIKHLGLPVKNIVDTTFRRRRFDASTKASDENEKIYCPGSLLKVQINNSQPLGYGMEDTGVIFSYFSPVFSVEGGEVVASYPPYNPLLSGLLVNGNKLQGQAAAVELDIGKGKIDLLGFKVIHRAQAHGSFKFLFNSLIY